MFSSIADKKVRTPLEGLRVGAGGRQMAGQQSRHHTRLWGTTMFASSDTLRETVPASSQAGLTERWEGIRNRGITCMRYGHRANLARRACPLHSRHPAVAPHTPVRTLVGYQAVGATREVSDRVGTPSSRAARPCEAEPLTSVWGNPPT